MQHIIFQEISKLVGHIETKIVRFTALESLLLAHSNSKHASVELNRLVMDLVAESMRPPPLEGELANPNRVIDAPRGEIARALVRSMAIGDQDSMLPEGTSTPSDAKLPATPSKKQYILHWMVPRPGLNSRPQPQRMYAEVDESGDFHLCGAFSTDVAFQ